MTSTSIGYAHNVFYDADMGVIGEIYRDQGIYYSTWDGASFTLRLTLGGGIVFKFKALPISGDGLEYGRVWVDTETGILHAVTS